MKTFLLLALVSGAFLGGCAGNPANNVSSAVSKPAATATPAPAKTPSIPKDGDYDAKGTVTKINTELGSIELDHDDIPGVMPPMTMEFNVSDKKILEGLKVGDRVDFVLRYKHPTETIVKIEKAK